MTARTRIMKSLLAATVALALAGPVAGQAAETKAAPSHGLSMYGDLKYPANYAHFDYADPAAPKGGLLRLAGEGTFDSVNPYILKGVSAPGIGLTFDTLMEHSSDEPFAEYGLLAETAEIAPDRSAVTFTLRPEAKFNDGTPVTAADVVFTFNTLMEKGAPFYRAYYADVKDVKAEGDRRVTFTFKHAGNRELPLIVGELPVLPAHAWKGKDFAATTLSPLLGSGPYKVESVDAGRRIVYTRVKDWWAKDLPVAKGRYNFDTVTYDMYRDSSVLLQAFFAGEYDLRQENIAKAWASDYNNPVVNKGWVKKEEIKHEIPTGLQGFLYNTRRDVFKDARVREALNYAFDFEWSNRQFASDSYKRTASYFENSELAARGKPEGRELEILQELDRKYPGAVPPRALTDAYANPHTSGNGTDVRGNLAIAQKMLAEAGWALDADKKLAKDGKPLRFEILLNNPAFERWTQPFIANLKKLGITASIRTVDPAQYQNRMDAFDYDMTVGTFGESLSPGNEQRDFWGSDKVDVKGSRNLMGVNNPAIDDVITRIVSAQNRADLVAATHALDRLLLWNFYAIPQWHIDRHRVAYWDRFSHPATTAKYNLGIIDTWWYDADKAAKLPAVKQRKDQGEAK